jgi:hypothetical protein
MLMHAPSTRMDRITLAGVEHRLDVPAGASNRVAKAPERLSASADSNSGKGQTKRQTA